MMSLIQVHLQNFVDFVSKILTDGICLLRKWLKSLEKKIMKSNTSIVDTTHTKARCNQKLPKEFLQYLRLTSNEY